MNNNIPPYRDNNNNNSIRGNNGTVTTSAVNNNRMYGNNGVETTSTVGRTNLVGNSMMGGGQPPIPKNNNMYGRGTPPIPNAPYLGPTPHNPSLSAPPFCLPPTHQNLPQRGLSDLPQKVNKKTRPGDRIIFEAGD